MNKGLKKQIFSPRGLAVNSIMTKQLKFVLQRPHLFGLIFDISFFLFSWPMLVENDKLFDKETLKNPVLLLIIVSIEPPNFVAIIGS